MNFELKTLGLAEAAGEKCDALVVLLADSFKPGRDSISRLAAEAIKGGDLETKAGKLLQLYRTDAASASRVVLVGAGDGSARQVRQAVNTAVATVRSGPVKKLLVVSAAALAPEAVRAAVMAAAESSYIFTTTKSKAEGRKLDRVTLGVPDAAKVKAAFTQGTALVAGIEFAKEWGNRPPNYATPTLLAGAAKSLARPGGIKCEVLGPKEIEKLGMGSFLGVAQGSVEPARFIVLKYEGAKGKSGAPVVLVGKGITFDTGGISIKPASEMDEMKFDMCGAASVLGVFRALGELKPALDVIGLIPACENMPDGGAVKPGDVVTTMSGQTVEILNTDAEGRLVLCDALTYAERFKPHSVVDIATLTGACVIALGGARSGLFSPDEELAAALFSAGESALDPCWRMPLDDDYAEGLKTNFADVANVAGRAGGAISAAKFLQRFTAKYPWAHLDIAGTAWRSGAAKGATGRPVALLVEYLLGVEAAGGSARTAAKPAGRPASRPAAKSRAKKK